MARKEADLLQGLIERGQSLPGWGSSPIFSPESQRLDEIELYVALRDTDRKMLKKRHPDWSMDRPYRADSLPERISEAFSDLLFGDPPTITPSHKDDAEVMEKLTRGNNLSSQLKRWATDVSAEGEQWYRIYVNPDVADVPIVEMHSRLDVVPYWVGPNPKAVAFFNELYSKSDIDEKTGEVTSIEVWRHVEIQTDNMVRNLLYRGTTTGLGERVPLDRALETEDLDDEWDHDLGMLAGRIPNKVGRDIRRGVSHYRGILDQLLDLNEARSIMAENARLAAKKRMLVPTSALDEDGNWGGAGDDVIPMESLSSTLDENGGKGAKDYAILEYNFDAGPVIAHINELVTTALTRVGLNVQFVNGNVGDGSAASGTALRVRLIPTTLATDGLGRHWDDIIPKMLLAMQKLDALPIEQGGCGHTWKAADEAPAVKRGTVLPEDPQEKGDRHIGLVAGELESQEMAIADLHPEWNEKQVLEEIQRIRNNRMPFEDPNAPGAGGDNPLAGITPDDIPVFEPGQDVPQVDMTEMEFVEPVGEGSTGDPGDIVPDPAGEAVAASPAG